MISSQHVKTTAPRGVREISARGENRLKETRRMTTRFQHAQCAKMRGTQARCTKKRPAEAAVENKADVFVIIPHKKERPMRTELSRYVKWSFMRV
jgi:hypothetical protein